MRLRMIAGVLALLTTWGLAADIASASLPDDRYADYFIREDPLDEESDIEFIVRLELSAVSQSGSTIAWDVVSITYVEVGTGGSGDKIWTDDSPLPATSNGYWNVTHAVPSEPQVADFDYPPVLIGTAKAEDTSYADLDYDFSGDDFDPQYSQYFGGMVAGIHYVVTYHGDPQPVASGSGELTQFDGGDSGSG